MALIVEDGTGLATAESYVSVVDYQSYNSERGKTDTATDADIEERLRLVTEYIDIRWGAGVLGTPLEEDQALVFPTTYFTDPLPLPLVRACFEYAFFLITNPLFIDRTGASSQGSLIRDFKQIGPIITDLTYTASSSGASSPKVVKADKLMRMVSSLSAGGVIR